MKKQAIIFDLDGPILEISRRYKAVYTDGMKSLGAAPLPPEEFWSLKREGLQDSEILARTGCSELAGDFASFKRLNLESADYLAMDSVFPKAPEILQALSVKYYLVLVTLRRNRTTFRNQIEELGISRFFSEIPALGSRAEFGAEVKQEMIRNALSAGNVPEPVLLVGDSEADVMAGKTLSIMTCAVENGIRSGDYLRTLEPDFLCQDIGHLPSWL